MPLNGKTKDIFSLTPKRRRTTGNLKTLSNGQLTSNPTKNGLGSLPATPGIPTKSPRPLSQHDATNSATPAFPDGNLFYAYARRGDDLQSRYLLTFASASVANEWWQLLQANFKSATRPGPQLFSFRDPETLVKAWRHPKFDHLKSKWMYISFSDTGSNGLGGAAQGIIPVQDIQGNMLGGGSTDLDAVGEMKRETKEARNDISRLEEYFARMVESFDTSMAQAAASVVSLRRDSVDDKRSSGSDGGYFGTGPDLSEHLARLTDLLAKNAQHVEALATRQSEHDEKLHAALRDAATKQKSDELNMVKLGSHLDRIQGLMEQSAMRHQDHAEVVKAQPIQIDFSPLTDRLEKVQDAVEQNSALIKALLDEGTAESKPSTPFWGKVTPVVDLSPLAEHLQKIHSAIEQQSSHMQALVGFAAGDDVAEGGEDGSVNPAGTTTENNLAPLGEHLEQIYEEIAQGNRHAREDAGKKQPVVDFTPISQKFDVLAEKLGSLQIVSEQHLAHTQSVVGTRARDSAEDDEDTEGDTLSDKLNEVNEHLQCLREWTEFDSEQFTQLLEVQKAAHESSRAADDLSAMRKSLEQNTEYMRSILDARPLSAAGTTGDADFSPLTDRLNRIHESLEKQYADGSPGIGDARFLLSALTSHLSKIQGVTEQNALQVRQLRERQTAGLERMQTALTDAAGQVQALASRQIEHETTLAAAKSTPTPSTVQQQRFEQRLEATSSQVRELMSGHREMLEVLREVARSLSGSDQIVIPPPRKMGRKVVGFVYDAKDGPV